MLNLLKFINSKKVKDLQRVVEYGKTKNAINLFDLRESNFAQMDRPIVFLSTGRCGTAWLTKLLENDASMKLFHAFNPAMRAQSKLSFAFNSGRTHVTENENSLLLETFLAGREDLFLYCAKSGKRPIITDSDSTFFAYQLLQLFPNAKFIHLHRDPGEFIRSGMRRSWYEAKQDSELSRIEPLETDENHKKWRSWSTMEKIAWLWDKTNRFIEEFATSLPPESFYQLSFNDWSEEEIAKLLAYIDSSIDSGTISKNLKVKVNAQLKVDFPKYKDWEEEDKQKVKAICGALAQSYGYSL